MLELLLLHTLLPAVGPSLLTPTQARSCSKWEEIAVLGFSLSKLQVEAAIFLSICSVTDTALDTQHTRSQLVFNFSVSLLFSSHFTLEETEAIELVLQKAMTVIPNCF